MHSSSIAEYYHHVALIGTPPRIDGKTVNYSTLQVQPGDDPPTPFSFMNEQQGIQVKNGPS